MHVITTLGKHDFFLTRQYKKLRIQPSGCRMWKKRQNKTLYNVLRVVIVQVHREPYHYFWARCFGLVFRFWQSVFVIVNYVGWHRSCEVGKFDCVLRISKLLRFLSKQVALRRSDAFLTVCSYRISIYCL